MCEIYVRYVWHTGDISEIFVIYTVIYSIVVGVIKMGYIMSRVEPTSLAFWASVLTLHHAGSLMSPLYPHLPVYAAPCLRGQCRLLNLSPWNCKSFNAYNYMHTGNDLTYGQCRLLHYAWYVSIYHTYMCDIPMKKMKC